MFSTPFHPDPPRHRHSGAERPLAPGHPRPLGRRAEGRERAPAAAHRLPDSLSQTLPLLPEQSLKHTHKRPKVRGPSWEGAVGAARSASGCRKGWMARVVVRAPPSSSRTAHARTQTRGPDVLPWGSWLWDYGGLTVEILKWTQVDKVPVALAFPSVSEKQMHFARSWVTGVRFVPSGKVSHGTRSPRGRQGSTMSAPVPTCPCVSS